MVLIHNVLQKISLGFQISLQAQSVIYLESFHEGNKSDLSDILEKENWKKISQRNDHRLVMENEYQLTKVPLLHRILFHPETDANTVSNKNYQTTCCTI